MQSWAALESVCVGKDAAAAAAVANPTPFPGLILSWFHLPLYRNTTPPAFFSHASHNMAQCLPMPVSAGIRADTSRLAQVIVPVLLGQALVWKRLLAQS